MFLFKRQMLPGIVILTILLSPIISEAKPGFGFDLGFGGVLVNGEDNIGSDRLTGVTGGPFTTNTGSGMAALLRASYNILGYGALELGAAVNAGNLENFTEAWAIEGSAGFRVFPLWYWQNLLPTPLQALEPSLFLGAALVYQIYKPRAFSNELGWRKAGAFQFGLGADYYLSKSIRIGFHYALINAPYDRFIFNYSQDVFSDVNPPVDTTLHQIFVTLGASIDPFDLKTYQKEVPASSSEESPAPAPVRAEPKSLESGQDEVVDI